MDGYKIIKLSVSTIALTIVVCFAWWLLLRPSSADAEHTLRFLSTHQSACQQVASYLTKHNYATAIYAPLDRDTNCGIRQEESSDYMQFAGNISELFNDNCSVIYAEGNAIRIAIRQTGGIFCKKHAELIYSANSCTPFMDAVPTRDTHWSYRIVSDT